jgi:capsular polysaccharide biosynthesis protein
MLQEKTRGFIKDVLLVSAVFATLSGAYLTFAVAERYRALTRAYIAQSEQLIQVLQQSQASQTVTSEELKDQK